MTITRIKNLVSIVITNYNNGRYIEECLNSILNQTYKEIEIIVIDDGSTDSSEHIIKKWEKENLSRFHRKDILYYIKLPRNIGFAGALNLGFFMAKGEFIAVQDADDISHEKRIEKQVNFLSKNKNIAVVGTNYVAFEDGNFNKQTKNLWLKYGLNNIKESYSRGNHCVCHGTILFRAEIFDKLGGPTRRLVGAEDYEVISKFIGEGVDNIQEVLYYYRAHPKQRSKKFYSKKKLKNYQHKDIRVLMILDGMDVGGTETYVLTLSKYLVKMGANVVIAGRNGNLYGDFKKIGCPIYLLKKERESFEKQIRSIIESKNINIVHLHHPTSGLATLNLLGKIKIPSIFTIHGLYYKHLMPHLKKCSKVISVSEPVKKYLLNHNVNSTLIPNGIDTMEFYPESNSTLRNELNIPLDAFVILYVSRLAWGKLIACKKLMHVCNELRKITKRDVHLVVVGTGQNMNTVENLSKQICFSSNRKFIHLLGERLDLRNCYTGSDCVVGAGRVALEAMFCGKPVVAMGNHGYFGLVEPKVFNEAWLNYFGDHNSCDDYNTNRLLKCLKLIISSKENLLFIGESSRKWVAEKFDIKNIADDILKEYISIIK
ncbi:glycosyltransferase [Serpentinicella alkaliphila]|uniref:Glycosyl transferase family 1 n=1 Tax=Serpentinicella alkaliphila TaxID=1734049 RepID=A0A4R2TET0_9FIRM|nr:glycosyltransferase [Serpentinicella alkaliphila]QUH26984.1 glycosyltransferase [Serpentinicella alkaliphila]TCQ00582.1 glycosyl transferase family 1 [Serpentinicella alkaliphila]